MSEHRHIWAPLRGVGRMWALAIAKRWVPTACVVCGKPRKPAKEADRE